MKRLTKKERAELRREALDHVLWDCACEDLPCAWVPHCQRVLRLLAEVEHPQQKAKA